ncbi:hypothetical protein ACFX2I_019481 [Malus domestica]
MSMPMPTISTSLSEFHATAERKRHFSDEMKEKMIEMRQKRMIKNSESAARSRARKQAYTNQLKHEVFHLRKMNGWLKKQKDPFVLSTTCGQKSHGDNESEHSNSEAVDGDEDGDEEKNNDGGFGDTEEELSSEDGGAGNNPNGKSNNSKAGPGGEDGEVGEDGEEEEDGNNRDDNEDDGEDDGDEDNEDDEDDEDDDEGEVKDEEEIVDEEEPEDDEEEDEEEALQPPKKRKK